MRQINETVGAGPCASPREIAVDVGSVGAGFKPAPTRPTADRRGLPEIIQAFKTSSARRVNEWRNTAGQPVWQRNYYDHVIRDEDEVERIRSYIAENPARWEEDEENPGVRRAESNDGD